MTVRVIKSFRDILDKTITHKVGEVFKIDDKSRVDNLVLLGYVEVVEENKTTEKKKRIKK